MGYLTFAKVIMQAASALMRWLGDRQLIEAGAAQAALNGLEQANASIREAMDARRGVKHDADSVRNDRHNRD